MTRPDWCPQDVWDAAGNAWREAGFVNDRLEQLPFIARAIFAERERCAAIAKMVPNASRERAMQTDRDKQWIELMDQVAVGIEEGIVLL